VSAPARGAYRTIVVGGGIVGLYTAYRLAQAGAGPILVVDRGFLSGGASGRNGGGVRQQWETPATIRLAREAVGEYRRFGRDFGYNPWFRQGGYLFLAGSEAELARLRSVHATVRAEGLPSELLSPEEVERRVPALAVDGIVGASFLDSDGTLYPFPVVWGVYEAARALGVEVAFGVEALGVEVVGGRVRALGTSAGRLGAQTIVNAAGGWSAEFSRRAGLDSANVASRHEILATEPLKRCLDPMLIRLSDGLYLSQTMRGELVGGLTMPHPPGTAGGMSSSPAFLSTMARAIIRLLPRAAGLGVLRAWSGFYDDTPDGLPVIGEDPRLPGFVHGNGFGGHGFMLAPASSRRIAQAVLGEKGDLDPAAFGPERFLGPARPAPSERLQPG
jgi:sarcosine oxidase, subunit beta